MKKILVVLMLCLNFIMSNAEKVKGFAVKTVSLNKTSAVLLGGRGYGLFDDNFAFGFGGYTTVSDGEKDENSKYFSMGCFGAYLIKKFPINEKISINSNLFLAYGGIESFDKDGNIKNNVESSSIQIVEPAIGIGYNINNVLSINAEMSYLKVNNIDLETYSDNDFGGVTYTLAFEFKDN